MSFNIGCRQGRMCSKRFPDSLSKPVGIPEPVGLVCTITLGDFWDIYNWLLEMDELSRFGIGYDETLAV